MLVTWLHMKHSSSPLKDPISSKSSLSKESAAAIWTRLKDEYGKSLDFEYIRVNAEFQSLRKDQKTSMTDHVNKFNSLLQAVNYNRPPEIDELGTASINLSFLQSLGSDWEIWGMAKGENIRKTATAELMAEVRALAMRSNSSQATEASSKASQQSQEVKALATRFNDNSRGSSRKWKGMKGGKNNGHPHQNRDNGHGGKNRGKHYDKKSSYDPNKYCSKCQRVGHDIFVCQLYAKEQQEKVNRNNNGNNNHGSSRPDSQL